MQISIPTETTSTPSRDPQNPSPNSPKSATAAIDTTAADNADSDGNRNGDKAVDSNVDYDDESVIDISGKTLEFDLLEKSKSLSESVKDLYLYKNAYSLVPSSVAGYKRLKTLKFFGNEVNLLPSEFGNLVGVECLQVKFPSLNGLGLSKLKGLKELELSRVPPRPSVLTILTELAGLTRLTKLSVCHFSIRYLPPEIGCLINLEYLDLSFNKIKSLPTEISHLNALISFRISNNKLVELPSELSSLQRLKNLDLSNNRLTSLGSLELVLMVNLQILNLQNNKLHDCQIPSWIYCKLEGNVKSLSNDDSIGSSVDMDVYEDDRNNISASCIGCDHVKGNLVTGSSSNSRCFAARKLNRGWRRQQNFQQRARQERLNSSRKSKCDGHAEMPNRNESEDCKTDDLDVFLSETQVEGEKSCIIDLDGEDGVAVSREGEGESSLSRVENDKSISEQYTYSKSSSYAPESMNKDGEDECSQSGDGELNGVSCSGMSKVTCNSKRHSDRDLDNPKPCKSLRPTEDCADLSRKYSSFSLCSIDDYLLDGFYDAGRDRPFLPLSSYDQILPLNSREVILLNREKDEELDAITLSAQSLISRFKRSNGFSKDKSEVGYDNLQIGMLLALFVSDHFGGCDRSSFVERTRKSVSGSNYMKPFVCTCSAGCGGSMSVSSKERLNTSEDIIFTDIFEKSIHSIKARQSSIVVPIGRLQFGVCRHRALLMKYLCDRMEPPIPCELVRGYLDFMPHAWNIVLVKRGDSFVRMVVDACRPHDVREETNPEYFCRYIPLSRMKVPISAEVSPVAASSFPSFSKCDKISAGSSTVLRCKVGSFESAAKVCTLEACRASEDEIRTFEYSCLGEVRILGALQHSCIVEMYGHRIYSKWVTSDDGVPDRHILQYAIFMEYIKGGSLKSYLEKISKTGLKHLSVELALRIAEDVASALVELHSKDIIHRDIKSENILIDVDCGGSEGMAVVKLCDFDRAVPLRSSLHTCCISHRGIAPPDVCVGTPRWMAPEVFRTMHEHKTYGLEVDIWSYGCLLLEMLTLQVPYSDVPELHIHELLQKGERPPLTEELEALGSPDKPNETHPDVDLKRPDHELETLRFLVDLFWKCTESNPSDRPTAAEIYKLLCSRTSGLTTTD